MLLYVFLGAKCSGILNSIQTHHQRSLILHVAERNMPQKYVKFFIWYHSMECQQLKKRSPVKIVLFEHDYALKIVREVFPSDPRFAWCKIFIAIMWLQMFSQ